MSYKATMKIIAITTLAVWFMSCFMFGYKLTYMMQWHLK